MQQMSAGGVLERVGEADTAYSMRLDWDSDDRIFVVTVPELPGCMTHGATRGEAVRKGEEAIAAWLEAARHWGTPIPPPAVVRHPVDEAVTETDAVAVAAHLRERIARLMPDEENLPAWVRAEFSALAEETEHLPVEEQIAAIVADLSEPARDWIKRHALHLIESYKLLTGEDVPVNDLARRDAARFATGLAEGDAEGAF